MSSSSAVENDMEPLVRNNKDGGSQNGVEASTSSTSGSDRSFVRRFGRYIAMLFLASIAALFIFWNQYASVLTGQDVEYKHGAPKSGSPKHQQQCRPVCKAHLNQMRTKWDGDDLLDAATMLRRAQEAKTKTLDILKSQYGAEYVPKLFLRGDNTVGKTAFVSPGNEKENVSRKRFIRKFQMKLLSAQLALQDEMEHVNGCDCRNVTTISPLQRRRRYLQETSRNNDTNAAIDGTHQTTTNELPPLSDYYARMVWATGGHSATAAHGNFHNESYTAVMERMAKYVFEAVGIQLEGRNYAMGGMSSAPELSLCNEAIYGTDVDILSWDFGMTDGRDYSKKQLYGHRAGVHLNRPLYVDMGVLGSRATNPRITVLEKLQEAGLAIMYHKMDLVVDQTLKDAIPDMQGKTQQEMDAIPEFLRYFKCGTGIENGDPSCGANKYTKTNCKIKGRVSWHPGWKVHALNGNLMALFMIELLLDALKELVEADPRNKADRKALLHRLQSQEDADYAKFFNSNIPEGGVPGSNGDVELAKEVNPALFYRNRTMCHTALLPAATRYKGILTEPVQDDDNGFDIGMQKSIVDTKAEPSNTMRLTYDQKDGAVCPITTFIDYKDYFYVRQKDGAATLTLPNDAEQKAYLGNDDVKLQGLVLVCFVTCDWGKCPRGEMQWQQVNDGNVTMAVNGNRVTELKWLNGCSLLRGEHGYFWKATDEGQYELMVRVNVPGGFVRLTSVIVL